MSDILYFLSGNIPGGIYLLLFLIAVVVLITFFLYRVNEFFTGKHFFRVLFISIGLLILVYSVIWYQNPPQSIYSRYTIDQFSSNTRDNWLGKNLTGIVSNSVEFYQSKRNIFFPNTWLYRLTPLDSVERDNFRKEIYQKLPVQKVLTGKVFCEGKRFQINLSLINYPQQIIISQGQNRFEFNEIEKFLSWINKNFGKDIPFKNNFKNSSPLSLDSVLTRAQWHFFRKEYRRAESLLQSGVKVDPVNTKQMNWLQFSRIRLAGIEKVKLPPENIYSIKIPPWKKNLRQARDQLITLLQADQGEPLSNLMVAESYIWEEEFDNAEIFLEQAYVQNPLDIDVLLNLSSLHSSRYHEFGYKGKRDIYQNILTLCPIDERVLLLWSNFVVESHPVYTPSPELAKVSLERYIEINPYSAEVWLMLGEIYARQTKRQEALEAFFIADSLKPEDGRINYNIGVLYYEWDKVSLAKDYFLKSINYDDYLDSHLYLGAIYQSEKQFEKALEKFRYRVAHKSGEDDLYAYQAMNGIKMCLDSLGQLSDEGQK